MDLDSLPKDGLERLRAYRESAEEERVLVEALRRKRVAGMDLTEAEQRTVAYSPYGTGGGCPGCG